jgi:hypothetical protein
MASGALSFKAAARGTVAITFRADPAQALAEELQTQEHNP